MRVVRPLFTLLVALFIAAAVLTYLHESARKDRIYLPTLSASSDQGNTGMGTHRAATGDPDPYHQRYYSQSEGWTYYDLPSYSSGR